MDELNILRELLDGGGNAAQLALLYVMWRAERRLTALETALHVYAGAIKGAA